MRSCIDCIIKHLGQAQVLYTEWNKSGEDYHLVIGHLAEAEDHAVFVYLELAWRIREIRLDFMAKQRIPVEDLEKLVRDASELQELEEQELEGTWIPDSQIPGSQIPGSQIPGSQIPGSQIPGSQVGGSA